MKIFKLYMQIIKKNLPIISIYFITFIMIAVIMTFATLGQKDSNGFQQVKADIAFFDYDNTELTEHLQKNLERVANIIPMEDNAEKLQDSLFFRAITAVVRIPNNFTNEFLAKKDMPIEFTTIPNSYNEQYIKTYINNYLSLVNLYDTNTNGNIEELLQKVDDHMNKETPVELLQKQVSLQTQMKTVYFSYLPYVMIASCIMGIGTVMLTINQPLIKRRILVSKLKLRDINFGLTLGHIVFCMACLVIFIILCFLVKPNGFWQIDTLWLVMNSICMTLSALSIGFLIGVVVKSKSAQGAASNVIALGLSFISGCFVSQELLGATVLKIASFTPSYWFVRANYAISEITEFNIENLTPVLGYMGIELGFALVIWMIALVCNKKMRISDNG